jgi:Aldo/keto reductase family
MPAGAKGKVLIPLRTGAQSRTNIVMHGLPFGAISLIVSRLEPGTGNYGTGWDHDADAEAAAAPFNTFAEAGGNVIDIADLYRFGQSKQMVGSLLARRRNDFVLAAKYTNCAVAGANRPITGNSRKAMILSVEACLLRLNTDRNGLSVGTVRDACDNALAECVIGLFKTEIINQIRPWKSTREVEWETLIWIDWNNSRQLFWPIGHVAPDKAEKVFIANLNAFDRAA